MIKKSETEGMAFHNAPPEGDIPEGVPKEALKVEFAKRLQERMTKEGWNQSEMARRAALHMESGKFGRDNISSYTRGLYIPGPLHLNALASALRCKPDDLLPHRGMPSVDDKLPPLEMKELGKGMAWLRVNQAVDWKKALKIMEILKGD